ncbi:MAG: DUF3800 domain-containing protein [Planctomycetaceae bacterium]|nr:DUF3800 domain-containing protein [Planctomycetaceae bacterium]
MAESFNIYLDESCHLEHDGISVMTLGAIWCPAEKAREVALRVRDIQQLHGLSHDFEIKWTKVSPAKYDFYRSLVDYFLDDDDLHFRAVIIPDKAVLDHNKFGQSHDDWYYKMCFTLLEPIIDPTQHYAIYLDIKDTRSEQKRSQLEDVLRNAKYDGSGNIIRRIQQIRSHESELMQLGDLLIGIVTYANRRLTSSRAKVDLVERVRKRTGLSLTQSTWLREPKFNLLAWRSEK